jgi:hypothetical protein
VPSNYGQSWWIPLLSFGRLINGLTMHEQGWTALTFSQLKTVGPLPINPFFALIPVIGFGAALAAVRRIKQDRYRATVALAGCALVLTGVFLVKGSNSPLGGVYIWLFNHLPGFNMFRDANKMLLIVIIGYSVLFGLASVLVTDFISRRSRLRTWKSVLASSAVPVAILIVLCLLALPALSGHLGGVNSASRPVKVPGGYRELDKKLEGDEDYFRTFWLPDVQRFATRGPLHPAISAKDLFSAELAPLSLTEKPLSAIESPLLPGLLDAMAVGEMIVPEDADVPEFRLFQGSNPWEVGLIKRESEQEAAAVPGNSAATTYGGSRVFTREGKDHVFVPEGTLGILGDWNTALAANGAPGLDLNNCAYLFSQQGGKTTSALTEGFPADAFLSGEQTQLDAVMPFMGPENLVPVEGVTDENPWAGWRSLPGARFLEKSIEMLRSEGFDDRSLDYGLGGVISTSGYEKPPRGWQKSAKLVKNIDAGATPLQMYSDDKALSLKKDTARTWSGMPTIRGSMGLVRTFRSSLTAYSDFIPCNPFQPYVIRFLIAGEHLNDFQCKIGFFNSIGEWIGEKVLINTSSTFDYTEISDQFVAPAETVRCRFEVAAKEGETYPSSWNMSNVDIFDLEGISKHPKFTVTTRTDKKGSYHLMARCQGLEKGSRISFSVDGGKDFLLDTFSPVGRMRWHDLGKLELAPGEHSIQVTNLAGESLLNALALVSDEELSAAKGRLSAAVSGKDIACALDLDRYPEQISYSRGYLTRADSVYCPADRTLTPTFQDGRDWARSGIKLSIRSSDFDLARSTSPSGVAGWACLPELTLPEGPCRYQISYPAASLSSLPTSQRSLEGRDSQWQIATDGFVLKAEPLPSGEPALTGYVPPGDQSPERVMQSKRLEVSGNTDYSALFTLEGADSNTLFFSLKVYNEKGKLLDRLALSDEMNGTFSPRTTFKKVKLRHGARYAILEVVFHANPGRPSTWRLSGLLFNKTKEIAPPVDQIVLVPRDWAFPPSRAGEAKLPEVEVLESSPTKYRVKVSNAKRPFLMVFSERYMPDWELHVDGKVVQPVSAYTLLNCYPLAKKGSYEVTLTYRPQRRVNLGLIPSILTLAACFAFLLVNHYRRRRRQAAEGKEE